MLFNSIDFIIFFPIVAILHLIIPHKWRWLLLLLASCYFYMSFTPYYIFLIMAAIIVDYFIGILIENNKQQGKGNTKLLLIIGVVFPLTILFIFKYYNFFNQSITPIAKFLHLNYSPKILNVILPVGISFYTFQTLSYVIEVYRGNQKAERHFGIFSVFVMFFPQLVAGPIERPKNLLHQFYEKHFFDYQRVTDGLKLMAWGFFKKLVIADRMAIIANEIYNHPTEYSGIHLIIAMISFIYQVYCDFSGYSDIAIGAAQVMGFKLMTNFKRPYFAKSTSELWTRWHISLTSWFRDYVYISLGGSHVAKWRHYYNIFIVFVVTGIWHGANWTFVFWGAANGIIIIISALAFNKREKLVRNIGLTRFPSFHKFLKVFITMGLFNLTSIFFRANSISDAFYILSNLFNGVGDLILAILKFDFHLARSLLIIPGKANIMGFSKSAFLSEIIVGVLAIIFMEIVHLIQRHGSIRNMISQKPLLFRWSAYSLLMISILFFGMLTSKQFIYFRF